MPKKSFSFPDKNILVTGASGGLGSAIAISLAKMGANLVLTSRSIQPLNELIASFPDSIQAIPVTADLSKPGEAAVLAEKAISALGSIDVLFNNAGIGYFALMDEASEENIRHLFEVNTFSPLCLIQSLLPHMKSRSSGRIINIVSAAGRVPIPTVGVYGGSKSALAVMMNTMRLELEPSGIDVINIYPGTAATSFEENALREEERPGLCPRERCGIPRHDIAERVLMAASGRPGEVWLERSGKRMAIEALFIPRWIDKRLAPIRDRAIKNKSFKKRRWQLLQVESSLACNLSCVMCPWREISKKTENRGFMTEEVWNAIQPHLSEIYSVDFTGGGEPLLQSHLVDWVMEASKAGCTTGILTNGLLLTEKKANQLIHAGLDWICVSMDGATKELYEKIRQGSNFDRVCKNIENLSSRRSGQVPKIMINFVMMKLNFHQLEEIVRLASKLGVDQINFKQCDVIRGEHGKGLGLFAKDDTKEIRQAEKSLAKAIKLAKKMKLKTTSFSFSPEEMPVCEQDPRNSMFVRYDGSVGPCINLAVGGPTTFFSQDVLMPTIHYGRLPEKSLSELWEEKECLFYRECFEERVKTYDDTLVKSLGSSSNRERMMKAARESMPEAPEGCKICHYLYGV